VRPIDWRELYASNRAVIERSGGTPGDLPPALRALADPTPRRTSTSGSVGAPGWAHERRVTSAGRTRRALVHTPRGLDAGTAVPLICMLHGCTQDPASFAAATRMNEAADRHGFVTVYPEQTAGENQQRCWNWFLPEHQDRGTGEPASLAAIVRDVVGTNPSWTIDPRRVFVAGLSAGGAMAAVLAATYPDLFAAVAVHSGLAYRSATTMPGAFAAMSRGGDGAATLGARDRPLATMVIHGTGDRTVAPVNADHVLRQAMKANRRTTPGAEDFALVRPSTSSRGQVAGGHAYTTSRWTDRRGTVVHELVRVEGMGHAWSGGPPGTPHADPRGPDAAEAIWRFFADSR
jgi:poly(hydroxyalkanoate) depolymerase family esterase